MFFQAILEALTFGAILLLPLAIYSAVRLGKGLAEDIVKGGENLG